MSTWRRTPAPHFSTAKSALPLPPLLILLRVWWYFGRFEFPSVIMSNDDCRQNLESLNYEGGEEEIAIDCVTGINNLLYFFRVSLGESEEWSQESQVFVPAQHVDHEHQPLYVAHHLLRILHATHPTIPQDADRPLSTITRGHTFTQERNKLVPANQFQNCQEGSAFSVEKEAFWIVSWLGESDGGGVMAQPASTVEEMFDNGEKVLLCALVKHGSLGSIQISFSNKISLFPDTNTISNHSVCLSGHPHIPSTHISLLSSTQINHFLVSICSYQNASSKH